MITVTRLYKYIPYAVCCILSVFLYRSCNKPVEIQRIPYAVEIPIPVVEHRFDTIRVPEVLKTPERIIDTVYYERYISEVDSVKKDSIIKDALTVRKYDEKFEDSIQTIRVQSEVTGRLNSLVVDYKTKERSIFHKDTIEIEPKRAFYLGGGVGLPFKNGAPSFSIELGMQNKKGNIWRIGVDSKQNVLVKHSIKL